MREIEEWKMMRKRGVSARLRLGLTLVILIVGTPAAHAQAKWVRLAPFPEPAEEILGAAAGGKMYVFAGLAPVWKPLGMVYEYDPASNRWAKKNRWRCLRIMLPSPPTATRFTPSEASCFRNPGRRAGYQFIMPGNMTRPPTPGKRLRRCPASEVRPWRQS